MKAPQTIFLEDLIDRAMRRALELGVEDFSGKGIREIGLLIRFSENDVTLTNRYDISRVMIYLGCEKRRILNEFEEVDEKELLKRIEDMVRRAKSMEPYEEYVNLPRGRVDYQTIPGSYDEEVLNVREKALDMVHEAIDTALGEGVERVSGTLNIKSGKIVLVTSGERFGEFRYSNVMLNVRVFRDKEISGQWIGIANSLKGVRVREIAKKAAELALRANKVEVVKPGKYRVLLSPIVMANLLNSIGYETSAFYIDSGLSAFIGKVGEKVACEDLTLIDDPLMEGNPGSIPFDDEGTPTRKVAIIERGVLKTYTHNTTTAKKYGTESTGHAGIIVPMVHSLIVEAGDLSEDEMLSELKDGLYITNVWYTRFNSYITGEFSSIARDASFLVEKGEIKKFVKGARISDSIIRVINSIRGITSKRMWSLWWEYEIPVYLPHFIIDDVNITTGYI